MLKTPQSLYMDKRTINLNVELYLLCILESFLPIALLCWFSNILYMTGSNLPIQCDITKPTYKVRWKLWMHIWLKEIPCQKYFKLVLIVFLSYYVHCTLPKSFNSAHPNISMHILHNVLYTFPKVLTGRICVTIMSFFAWWSFPLFLWP